jgi:hypothetical protein
MVLLSSGAEAKRLIAIRPREWRKLLLSRKRKLFEWQMGRSRSRVRAKVLGLMLYEART